LNEEQEAPIYKQHSQGEEWWVELPKGQVNREDAHPCPCGIHVHKVRGVNSSLRILERYNERGLAPVFPSSIFVIHIII
jgi:hypothetical protein